MDIKQFREKEKAYKRRKAKRYILTGLVYYVFFTLLACMQTGFAPLDVVTNAATCLFFAPGITFINAVVFRTLYDADTSDRFDLEYDRGHLSN